MKWSQQHTQISSLCPSLVCSGSLPSALQLRWLWFPTWPVLPKRPRLPRSALWRAWQPPRVALRWGAMTVRARHLMLRANPHCHRIRLASSFQIILHTRPFLTAFQCTCHILFFTLILLILSPCDWALLSSNSVVFCFKLIFKVHYTSLLVVDSCN